MAAASAAVIGAVAALAVAAWSTGIVKLKLGAVATLSSGSGNMRAVASWSSSGTGIMGALG